MFQVLCSYNVTQHQHMYLKYRPLYGRYGVLTANIVKHVRQQSTDAIVFIIDAEILIGQWIAFEAQCIQVE